MKLRYTPAAICDIDEIIDYMSHTLMNPEAARRIVSALARDCARLKEQPNLSMELRKKTGRELDGRCVISGQYMVIYEVTDAVSILRVLDTRMDMIKILMEPSS